MPSDLSQLSPSERQTLRDLAEAELWVALQRLKAMGLAEQRGQAWVLTDRGRQALQRVLFPS
jgi:hypothetical protein